MAQAQIDSVARDLAERFSAPSTDPTLVAGAPGLFTDAGSAASAANEVGLANRITVNPLVDPSQGGALSRLRDGIGAVTTGPLGNGARLTAMSDALSALRVPASGGLTLGAVDARGLASAFLSTVSTQRLSAEQTASYSAAQSDALTSLALQRGVDTDQQLQQLLVVEKSYAANAKVIQAADDMLQTLLGI